ncbi:ras GEF [Dothidotthia symphoricarpi CBS 119687]|uniref:Ras GEF n=1 Tax=Dothidotthia symphoricarpi CBS 119687 TaxID=1392245 RepID=A0A6A6AJT4_9PLEO|nr:ras GEF [Dothidotthia symphoricarpi CBS 119687]KAF2131174.1 ras GEF [Dothidotthia symphoricarpi CBS 119687]
MPTTARAAGAAGQTPTSHTAPAKRSDKALSAQSMQSLKSAAGPRPGLQSRAYSVPTVPQMPADSADEQPDGEEIVDDAFFQRYTLPGPVDYTHEEGSESSENTEGPLSPSRAKHDAAAQRSPSTSSDSSDSRPAVQDINIAVLGARGTGKSSFVRRALGLPAATASAMCSRKWALDDAPYMVRLLEIDFNDVHIGDRNTLRFPDTIDDMATPRIDGAVTIYDVTTHESVKKVPEMLYILSKTSLPFILVACKCDQHPAHREVDPAVVGQKATTFLGDVGVFQTSQSALDTYQTCLSAITRAAIAAKRPRSQASMARRRANSSAVRSINQKDLWAPKHERASSEISVRYRRGSGDVKGHRYLPSDSNKTFFNADESPGYDSDDSGDQGSDTGQSFVSVKPSDENGYTFNQLVDRLLAQPVSKSDTKFVAIFLALYRRFATPGQLLEAILKRFEAHSSEKCLPMFRIIAQQRYLVVLQKWVAYYPGDFAYATTRRLVRKFTMTLTASREYSVAATEIIRDLEMVTEDDDTDWACSDRQRAHNDPTPSFHNSVLDEDSEDDEFTKALGHMSTSSDRFSIARSSVTDGSRTTQSTIGSMGLSQTLLSQVERNERLAQQLEPNPIKQLSKIQWHQLMNETDEAIARELTRIDGIMFSSMRPRDLVRHVSLNAEEKKRCKNLENVTRMTEHFNHIAYLVTNYILLRDKPKHRALMLEKWMKIARQLRKLNNYNSLGAVLAGIKGTAVHRLIATRDLVPEAATHDFMKLDILMGPQKSHFAYRLAWENSSGERIPYIPLHRRDLVSASEGNSTFLGDKSRVTQPLTPHPGVSVFQGPPGSRDSREAPPSGVVGKERINWKKFEIMGDVIVGVQRAQGTPYPTWHKCEEVRNLILDVKISKDDDDLYDRSTHLEAPGANDKGRIARWLEKR